MQNEQAPEKKQLRGDTLDVVKVFPTIQGEGPFAGQRATFVRLAGCNLQCPMCDTDYTTGRQRFTVDQILLAVHSHPAKLVVISGGEPFRQDLEPLIRRLWTEGYQVQIETNGTLGPRNKDTFPWAMVSIVVSPKTGRVRPEIASHAHAYKYVLRHCSIDGWDGLPVRALDHPASPRVARPPVQHPIPKLVYVQPADEGGYGHIYDIMNNANRQRCVEAVLQHGYILCLQQHKLVNVE